MGLRQPLSPLRFFRGSGKGTAIGLGTTFPLLKVDSKVPPLLVLESSLIDPCILLLLPVSGWKLNSSQKKVEYLLLGSNLTLLKSMFF
jgi:hypothetical protein